MGELIAAMVEFVVGFVMAIVQLLPLIFEGLIYLGIASATIVAYAVSSRFREKKRKEWGDKPWKKYFDLGFSGVCLGALLGFAIWIAVPPPKSKVAPEHVEIEKASTKEDVRLRIRTQAAEGTNDVTIAVKTGGVKRILETESLKDLSKAIQENVTIVRPETGIQTNSTNDSRP